MRKETRGRPRGRKFPAEAVACSFKIDVETNGLLENLIKKEYADTGFNISKADIIRKILKEYVNVNAIG